ncbi:MAG: BLUF domain-containing protein [Polaromonas sp.]|nr:BLUF domain-containing protein [Polaromonas sp.]
MTFIPGLGHTSVLRVICASVSMVDGSVMEELLAMREQVSAFNIAVGVRSALLHSSGWFFQWYEGSVEGVNKALRVAQADPRHGRMQTLHRSVGPATLDEPLQIATTHSADKPTDLARRLFRLKQGQALEGTAQPHELWMQLVAPPGLMGSETAESALVQRHVVAVTSGNSGAVDLVRSIGQRAGAHVTYQRFASGAPKAADVGAVYVDLPGSFHVMRLQALSRRSLSHPMVRLMLRDVQCVLLLLGEHVDSSRALAGDVGTLLQRLALRPSLRLAGACPGNAGAARECLHASSSDISDLDPAMLWQAGPDALFRSLLGTRHRERAEIPALIG